MESKRTPLYEQHLKLNGRIVDFSGWALPLEYKSILLEAKATRNSCGIFDASHMGEIEVGGDKALNFLQRLLSNDLSLIRPGEMQYNLIINPQGGVIDDCMVYCFDDKFFCVVNASNKDKVFSWFNKNIGVNATASQRLAVTDRSSQLALISLQGPQAVRIISDCLGFEAAGLGYMHFVQGKFRSKPYFLSRSGYTGEDGFELYVSWDEASFWWNEFFLKGEKFGITPCGLGARDILRIEAGYPLYGHELDETTNPYEAALSWAVKTNKDFIGKEKIIASQGQDLKKKRAGFVMKEPSVPRQGYPVYFGDKVVGEVTSGIFSPNLGQFLGMAYLNKEQAEVNTDIKIKIRDKFYRAAVSKFPFITPKTKKLANRGGIK